MPILIIELTDVYTHALFIKLLLWTIKADKEIVADLATASKVDCQCNDLIRLMTKPTIWLI